MLIEGGEHCANDYTVHYTDVTVEYGEHCGNDYAVHYTAVTVTFIEALVFIYT